MMSEVCRIPCLYARTLSGQRSNYTSQTSWGSNVGMVRITCVGKHSSCISWCEDTKVNCTRVWSYARIRLSLCQIIPTWYKKLLLCLGKESGSTTSMTPTRHHVLCNVVGRQGGGTSSCQSWIRRHCFVMLVVFCSENKNKRKSKWYWTRSRAVDPAN